MSLLRKQGARKTNADVTAPNVRPFEEKFTALIGKNGTPQSLDSHGDHGTVRLAGDDFIAAFDFLEAAIERDLTLRKK